jgi:hypothetical protein
MNSIYIFHTRKDQEYFFDLYPFFFVKENPCCFSNKDFNYFLNEINKNTHSHIIVTRWYYQKYSSCFNTLNKHFKAKLYLYDSCDGSDDLSFNIPDIFDFILRKQFYKNFDLYKIDMIGGKHFSNYYYENHGIVNKINKDRSKHLNDKVISKLVLFNNNLIGFYLDNIYPFPYFINKIIRLCIKFFINNNILHPVRIIYSWHSKYISNVLLRYPKTNNKKQSDIYLRFSFTNYDQSVQYHRKMVIDFVKEKKLTSNRLIGPTKASIYRNELKSGGNIFLSPYGTGEICYRDFEIIFHNNYLIKPPMDHLNTFPNIYLNSSLQYDLDFENLSQILNEKQQEQFQKQLFLQKFILGNAYKNLDKSINDIF